MTYAVCIATFHVHRADVCHVCTSAHCAPSERASTSGFLGEHELDIFVPVNSQFDHRSSLQFRSFSHRFRFFQWCRGCKCCDLCSKYTEPHSKKFTDHCVRFTAAHVTSSALSWHLQLTSTSFVTQHVLLQSLQAGTRLTSCRTRPRTCRSQTLFSCSSMTTHMP